MTVAITAWLIVTFLLGSLAVLAIWARGYSRARGLSVLGFILASPIAAVALVSALGWPTPLINGINSPVGDYLVLGSKMIVGKGIYVLLDVGGIEPRYYYIPWDRKKAKQLQDELNKAGKDGTVMMKILPFDWSWDQHQEFDALPPPKMMMPKPRPEKPLHFDSSI